MASSRKIRPRPLRRKGKSRARTVAPAPRIDWRSRPAPKPGSRQRAAYERSAVYRERQRAAAAGTKTRKRHTRALRRAKKHAAEPDKRLRDLAAVARKQKVLPKSKAATERISTVFRAGKILTLTVGKPLTENLITQVQYRIGRALIRQAAAFAMFVGVFLFTSYDTGPLPGGSRKPALKDEWWAPDAGALNVDHVSTRSQAGLSALLIVSEETLYTILHFTEGAAGAVRLESVRLSCWNDRTEKERRQWHRKHRGTKTAKRARKRPTKRGKRSGR